MIYRVLFGPVGQSVHAQSASLPLMASFPNARPPRTKLDEIAYIRMQPENGGIVVDVSEGGLGFQLAHPVQPGTVHFTFLRQDGGEFEATGTVAWKDKTGKKGGLRFLSLPQRAREELSKMVGQGAGQSTSPIGPAVPEPPVMESMSAEAQQPSVSRAGTSGAPDVVSAGQSEAAPEVPPDARSPVQDEAIPAARPDGNVSAQPYPSSPVRPGVPPRFGAGAPSLSRPYAVSPSRSETEEAQPNPPSADSPVWPSSASPVRPSSGSPVWPGAAFPLRQDGSAARNAQPENYLSLPLSSAPSRRPRRTGTFFVGVITGVLLAVLTGVLISRDIYPLPDWANESGIASLFRSYAGRSSQVPAQSSSPVPVQSPQQAAADSPAATPAEPAAPPEPSLAQSPSPASSLPPQAAAATDSAKAAPPASHANSARQHVSAETLDERAQPDDGDQADLAAALQYLRGAQRPRDSAAAALLLWRAVGNGNTTAELMLANLYIEGNGVEKSCEQARVLLTAVAQKGSAEAAQKLDQLISGGCH